MMKTPPRLTSSMAFDELLLQRISRLLDAGGGMVTRLCEGRFGITRREWRVLALLVKEQGILPSQLAERLPLDRARTSRAISSLVGKQLMTRQAKPGNRREAILTLTDKGQQVYEGMVPLAMDINRQLIAVLAPQDAQRLDAMLDRLQACADDMVAHADLPKADRWRGTRRGLGGFPSGLR
jgi:DNA-binding MarR family transcriptional regulator